MGNTLQYSGYVANKTPSANLIWAFTPGELKNGVGWLSEKAANYQSLVADTQTGVSAKKRLILAVPVAAPNKTDEFIELLDPKIKTWQKESFTIRIYDPSAQAYLESLMFKTVERLGKPIPTSEGTSVAFTLLTLKVKGGVITKPDSL
jgi:hypothetical protein